MNIIIVGDGKVGYTLANHLSNEDHNITIVDKNEEALQKADETLDVMCVKGTGASVGVLTEAGIDEADLVIAVTSKDELNMLTCFIAKKLSDKVKTIARIRDPEYYDDFTVLWQTMGVDRVINPELTAAMEIANILQFPSAMNIEAFFGGKERLAEFRVMEGDMLVGTKVSKLSNKLPGNVLFVAVERDTISYIPDGDFIFEVNDLVYVMGQISGITNLFKMLNRYVRKINTVLIIGGGRIAYYLTKIITKLGMAVKIIEIDADKSMQLAEALSEAIIIQGDGTNEELLQSENLDEVDAFVAMTGRDEENLIMAMYAQEMGVDKAIAMTTRMKLPNVVNKLGIDSIVDPKLLTVSYIISYVRGMQNSEGSIVEAVYKIMDGKAEVISFIATESTNFLNTPLKDLSLKDNIIIACILHNDIVTIPHGNEKIQVGDKVLIVSNGHKIINDLNNILA